MKWLLGSALVFDVAMLCVSWSVLSVLAIISVTMAVVVFGWLHTSSANWDVDP